MGKGSIALEKGSMVEEVQAPVTSFAVKNTFIEFCEDLDSEIIFAKQMTEPATLLKRSMSMSKTATGTEEAKVSQDPAGPEPEPASKEFDVTWERLVTDERWANQSEADQPEEQLEAMAMQAPWVAPNGEMNTQWGDAGTMMSQQYGMMSWPVNGLAGGYLPTHAAGSTPQKPSMPTTPAVFEAPVKRRRRRAGGSLIDLAKKSMEERLANEAAAASVVQTPRAVPAASAAGARNFCGTCQRSASAAFRFCHYCGEALQAASA